MAQRHVCASTEDLIARVVAGGGHTVYSTIVQATRDADHSLPGRTTFEVVVTADFGADDVLHYGVSAPQGVDDTREWARSALTEARALVSKAGLENKGRAVGFADEPPSQVLTSSPSARSSIPARVR